MPDRSYKLGLIGHPVAHSMSPTLHEAALAAAGLKGRYRLYPVSPFPGGEDTLLQLLHRLRRGELDGLNVTLPHKETVLPYLDRLGPAARRIGAVNTLYMKDGDLIGENTDAPGFLTGLLRVFDFASPAVALILGAGGGARAAAYALASAGWELLIAARRLDQASCLAGDLKIQNAGLLSMPLVGRELAPYAPALVVNATSLGMHPDSGSCPWPASLPFPPTCRVYDLVYNPRETLLVRRARQAGLEAAGGTGMLVEQAALAFEAWTGARAPREIMHQALSA